MTRPISMRIEEDGGRVGRDAEPEDPRCPDGPHPPPQPGLLGPDNPPPERPAPFPDPEAPDWKRPMEVPDDAEWEEESDVKGPGPPANPDVRDVSDERRRARGRHAVCALRRR